VYNALKLYFYTIISNELLHGMQEAASSGYERIQGELEKLDIIISKSSVANILRRNDIR